MDSSTKVARASLLVLGAAAFLVSADARVIDPLLHVIADQFGVSVDRASIVASAYTFPYGLFQLFYGPMGDRVGKLRVMSVALTLFAFGTAACALVNDLTVFAILRFVTGVVAAAIIPLSLGYIGDKVPISGRQVALGRFMSALMLGQILSSSMGGIFGEFLGWRGIFWVFGALSLFAAAALYRESKAFPEPTRPDRTFSAAPYLTLLKRSDARLVLGTVFLEGFLVFGSLPFLGSSLKQNFGLREAQIGLLLSGYGIGGLIYSVSVKKLVTKMSDLAILLLGGALLCVGAIALAFLPTWWLFIPTIIVFGMGYFTMHSTLQTRATELSPEARGTAVSLFAFFFFVGQAFGAAVLGRLFHAFGYRTGFIAIGFAFLAVAVFAWKVFPKKR